MRSLPRLPPCQPLIFPFSLHDLTPLGPRLALSAFCSAGQLGWLADHVVPNDSNPKTKEELVALFKDRLKPVKRTKVQKQQ